jgi:hypothetical protein
MVLLATGKFEHVYILQPCLCENLKLNIMAQSMKWQVTFCFVSCQNYLKITWFVQKESELVEYGANEPT